MEGKAGKAKRTEVLSHHRGAQLRYSWRAWKIKDSFRILGDDHVKVRNTFTGSRNRRAGAGWGRAGQAGGCVCGSMPGPFCPTYSDCVGRRKGWRALCCWNLDMRLPWKPADPVSEGVELQCESPRGFEMNQLGRAHPTLPFPREARPHTVYAAPCSGKFLSLLGCFEPVLLCPVGTVPWLPQTEVQRPQLG